MIVFLTSGVALGVHVPAVIMARRLAQANVSTEVCAWESLWTDEAVGKALKAKAAYHRNFGVAKAALRMVVPQVSSLDEDRAQAFFRWLDGQEVNAVVVLSGFWLSVAGRLRDTLGPDLRVQCCHIDSCISSSFRNVDKAPWIRDVWLANSSSQRVERTVRYGGEPLQWEERSRRMLVHGGGWGVGTYQAAASELFDLGWGVDVVLYDAAEEKLYAPEVRKFMINPSWAAWEDAGLPPFAEVRDGEALVFERRQDHHDGFELARRCMAMVSKPGGGTLLDSVAAATPLLFIEPSAPHEEQNAQLWCKLGLGMWLEDWSRLGDKQGVVLTAMHERLAAVRRETPDYVDELAMSCA